MRMRFELIYGIKLLLMFVCGVCASAQDILTEQEEIVVVEGEKYIFTTSPRAKYNVSNRRIAVCSNNGTITARKSGRAQIKISSPSGTKEIRLRVLSRRNVSPRGEFPVMAWYSLQEDLSKERFIELADAGFNVSFSYATDSIVPEMKRAINAVKGTGVKLLIPFRGFWVDIKPIVNYFKDDENLWGWYVIDEPSYDKFEEVKHFVDRIQAIDSSHPIYINLFPTYAPTTSFVNESYEQYVTKYVDQFSPSFLSFDHYPITSNGVRKDFYKNLDIISTIANRHGIPFWAFACCVKYSAGVPAPKLEHLKLEVYSALAFGAQGIEYFTYTTPRKEHGGNHFAYAPIDSKHNKTRTYDYVKEINTRLRCLERYFIDARIKHVGALGGVLDGMNSYPLNDFPKGIKSLSSSNTLLASWLGNDNSSIFVVVNTSIIRTSTIMIDSDTRIKKVSSDGQLVSVSPVEELLPGDMLVYVIDATENRV